MAHFNLDEYTTVAERIKLFYGKYPEGRILTTLVHHDPTHIIFKAELYKNMEDARPFVTGYAKEVISDRGVNRDFALENCETSSIGVAAKNANIGTEKNAISREEAAKVNKVKERDSLIQEAKAKMAQTATEYVPIAKEDDPWTIREAAPATTVDEAVNIVKDIIGGQTKQDIPHCSKCHDNKPMSWKTGVSGKTKKPWGNFSCYVCKDVIWYEIAADGSWQPQKNKW
jgi:hypothetical protein